MTQLTSPWCLQGNVNRLIILSGNLLLCEGIKCLNVHLISPGRNKFKRPSNKPGVHHGLDLRVGSHYHR